MTVSAWSDDMREARDRVRARRDGDGRWSLVIDGVVVRRGDRALIHWRRKVEINTMARELGVERAYG